MKNFSLYGAKSNAEFCVDLTPDKGVERVAKKVLNDKNTITGVANVLSKVAKADELPEACVFTGIMGESEVLNELEALGKINLEGIKGTYETYQYTVIDNVLIIAGSDKLGAIYGLFNLSELMGVSPLVYWSDANVPAKSEISVCIDETPSKQPSVRYRGFFINDEWPCFGNWTFEHFNGFTAEMYDHVFELLLRLKGNYLWPAMWTSSFACDGPDLKNYELATEYGIYIGNSHHEPCLRAGEEYSHVRGKDSIYGDAWNYHANTEGITRFWRDSLMERGGFTSMVTVGMRGEADSKILAEDATLKDNIDLLKDVITCQQKLIKEAEEKFNKKFPKVLALYKEVEPYYYGDENTEGLCEWDEISDVIMMLCEDNYGYLRTVPDDKMRKHPGGFGMYYHVDYHGSPISYEWINSSPLNVMWEQMTQAYEYGVRSVWILNVGDLKHNEFPLSYFLNLAYDFEKWGTKAPNTTFDYTKEAVAKVLGTMDESKACKAAEILTETVRLNGYRRPEALNYSIYSPTAFEEASEILSRCEALEAELKAFEADLSEDEARAWYSLTGFQTRAAINLIRMHIYGGMNDLLAGQGLKSANKYAALVKEAIKKDKELKADFADFNGNKWRGHEKASHVGFTKWNDDGCRYPLAIEVEPFDRPRLFVSRVDDKKIYDKVYGPCMRMVIKDFLYAGTDEVKIKLSNNGIDTLSVKLTVPENSWLSADATEVTVAEDSIVTFKADRSKLSENEEQVMVTVYDGDTRVELLFLGRDIMKQAPEESGVFMPSLYGYALKANHYSASIAPEGFEWVELEDYGVYGGAMKAFPVTKKIEAGNEPCLVYKVYSEETKEYIMQTDFAPTNPLSRTNTLRYSVSVNAKVFGPFNTVPKTYKSGEGSDPLWSEGALDHRRRTFTTVTLNKGVNEIRLLMSDPGLVPMKIYLYREQPPKAYFGMPESVRTK